MEHRSTDDFIAEARNLTEKRDFIEYLSPEIVRLLIQKYAEKDHGAYLEWKYGKLRSGIWGHYNPLKRKLVVNKVGGKDKFTRQVETILHEIQHWNQHVEHGNGFMQFYNELLKTYGYRRHPLEVDARAFAAKHLKQAIDMIPKYLGGKVDGDWDDIMDEITDEVADDDTISRKDIGLVLKDYNQNTGANMKKVLHTLADLGVTVR